MTFLVNLKFSRLDKFDGPIFGVRGRYMRGQAYSGMLIGLHILGTYIRGGEECGICAGGISMGFYGAHFAEHKYSCNHSQNI